MKKLLSFIIATMLIVTCFALTACFPSVDKAKENLEEAGYDVEVNDDQEELDAMAIFMDGIEEGDLTAVLFASKGTDNISVIYFSSASVAKDYFDANADEEAPEGYVQKCDGKIIYVGTEAAVKAAKG